MVELGFQSSGPPEAPKLPRAWLLCHQYQRPLRTRLMQTP